MTIGLGNTKEEFGFFKFSASTIKKGEADNSEEVKILPGIVCVEELLVKEMFYFSVI